MRLKLVPDNVNIDYFRMGKIWLGIPILAVFLSFVCLGVKGLNFGIDFLGGTTMRAETTNAMDIGKFRNALEDLKLGDVIITEVFDPSFGPKHVAQIRIQGGDTETDTVNTSTVNSALAALKAVDPLVTFTSVETVGPKVSGELINTALLSLALSMLGIMIYVWLRFEWQFGVAAVVSLFHDAVITIGILSLIGEKFDLTIVAAVLTVVGYSINDTVVIFDRIREMLMKYRQPTLKEIINMALNETLSRTVMTGITVLLALLALYIFGGDVIRGFALTMLIGVLIGVYSTVFVASQILLMLGVKRDWSKPTKNDGPDGSPFADPDAARANRRARRAGTTKPEAIK